VIVLVDNYDSFTYNLVQYLRELASAEVVRVVRNDATTVGEVLAWEPTAIVLSPGPGVPESAGVCIDLVRAAERVPLLGVCLGHQALAVAYGGTIVRAPVPRHGKNSEVHHNGRQIFAGLADPFSATRYHSLVAQRESLPHDLDVTAWTGDGLVMGLVHRQRPHFGVQFHPEAYLTQGGKQLLANFLAIAGIATGDRAPGTADRSTGADARATDPDPRAPRRAGAGS
jgi:anthranilate synthase/aminodeoxychorismate synthase-like glutamine amidotransferase